MERDFEQIVASLWDRVDYDIDGIVFEVTDETIKKEMGATRHHHRWQIAYKRNTEMAEVLVVPGRTLHHSVKAWKNRLAVFFKP